MLANWQTWLAALLCLAAAVYVLRRAWLALAGKKSGCGSGCSSCSTTTANARPLQQISAEKLEP